jgi:hypothetical protein
MPSMQVPIWVEKDCFGRVPVANAFARTSQPSPNLAMGGEVIFMPPCVCFVWRITNEIYRPGGRENDFASRG